MSDNFFSVLGDTIVYQDDRTFGLGDSKTCTSAQLPINGVTSLHIDDVGNFSQALNSPANFAGQTGPPPPCSSHPGWACWPPAGG